LLRNEFAHSRIPFTFETAEIREFCTHFKTCDLPQSFIPHFYLDKVSDDGFENASDIKHPKTRFISTCHNIANRLRVKISHPQEGDFVYPDDEPCP
jgi:hypothetical protein